MSHFTRTLASAFTVALITLPTFAGAQALPSAKEVLDRHVQAIGGKDAIMAIASVQQKGTLELTAMGISAEITVSLAQPNKMAMHVNIPGLGEMQQGFDGVVGWDDNPMTGPRLAEGEELEIRKETASFAESFALYDTARYTSIEVVEKTQYAGEEAYKVKFVRKVGRPSTEYYSVASGLRIGSQSMAVSPMGEIEINAVMGNYKQFGNVKLPTKLEQTQAGNDIRMTFTDITFNSVTDAAFALPPAVKALVKP